MIKDVTSTTAEERNEIAAPVALAVLVLVGLGGVLFVRRRKTV
jgi:LPXTG-motif cell wall-anchored protein